MNVKIDHASLNALREQLIQVSNTCTQMKHCLVEVDVNKPMVLDYLHKAGRLTNKAIDAFNEAQKFLNMTPEQFAEWWDRHTGNPWNHKS